MLRLLGGGASSRSSDSGKDAMKEELLKYCVSDAGTILDGMGAIEHSEEGVVIVADADGIVQGTLTDGDLRRALLSGCSLSDPLKPHIHLDFLYVEESAGRAEVLDLMQAHRIRHVPVLSPSRYLKGIHLLSSIVGSRKRPNWAVIMAGGKGTRLGALTENTPKPMIKVAGRPILERVILHLVSHGIQQIYISVNYMSEQIEEYFGDGSRFGCNIDYLRESLTHPLGTAGSLALLPEPLVDPVFVINGDLVTDLNVGGMLDFYDSNGFDLVMGLKPYLHEVPFGCVELEENRILALVEKPVFQQLVNVGAYVLSPEVVCKVPPEYLPITVLFDEALKSGARVGAYHLDGEWMDVGLPDQLRSARGLDK